MYRLLLILLGISLGWLQYRFWWGAGSMTEIHQMQTRTQTLQLSVDKNLARNHKLRMDIDDLKQNGEVLEELAREELGLIKPDEYFFRVLRPAKHR